MANKDSNRPEDNDNEGLDGLLDGFPSMTQMGDASYERPKGVEPVVIVKEAAELMLVYSPKRGAAFVDERIQREKECSVVGGVFVFHEEDVKDFGSRKIGSRTFILGRLGDGPDDHAYFKVPKRILGTEHDVLFHKDVSIDLEWFTPYDLNAHLSVFQKVSRLINEDIIIGGEKEHAIPVECWEKVVSQFPGKTEIVHYVEARIQSILQEYLPSIKDGESLLRKYLEKRARAAPVSRRANEWGGFDSYETDKYEFLCASLEEMLHNENLYETEWEKLILRFILLLYPQYVHAERQLKIHEFLSTPGRRICRFLDLSLFDADGHIDLIEIKRPSAGSVFRSCQDHDNNIPSLALSKTIMQIEKYVLYLQKGGYTLEQELNKAYPRLLPNGIPIKIVNPRGMVVFGRSNDMTADQILDLEVLKRKYAHVVDIITYDDLLRRFKNILQRFKTNPGADN